MSFDAFTSLVAAGFQRLTTSPVFVVELGDGELWAAYLGAFPQGTDPLYKQATEHDCRTCRHFIRRAGACVAVDDSGQYRTVWDRAAERAPEPYAAVATHLRDLVRAAPIRDLYRVGVRDVGFGVDKTRCLDKTSGKVVTWGHLHTGTIPNHLRAPSPGDVVGAFRTTVQVFERGLSELTPEAVDTVVALVEANDLYRGQEHLPALHSFQKVQRQFRALDVGPVRSAFVWAHADSPAARFRNTVIGTLVQDLSEGMDVERAVASFESKVAPQNYKRTSAIITPGMVKQAMQIITELGLEPALERRFAVIGDVSVGDVKWVDGSVQPLMKGGIGEALMDHAAKSRARVEVDEERAESIDLDKFVAEILPSASSVEILFKNEHVGNLVSVTAPSHPEPARLLRWDNDFAWSYGGNVADSIRERVKAAGGKVEGAVLRVSLSWFNYDDLDLHVHEPQGRNVRGLHEHIYFRNKRGWTGGELDVDMNAGAGHTRQAVENVVWMRQPPDGVYRVVVNNYARRESTDPGFVIEVESGGRLAHYSYNKSVRDNQDVAVVSLHIKGGVLVRAEVGDPAITAASISQDKWNLKTEQYVKVRTVMFSPNYWGGSGGGNGGVGNKHTFFIVDGCKNDEPTRGFYNEFLHPRLEPHRKVFEVIADKTKCAPSGEQLSGLGFSSTVRTSFTVRVQQGKRRRVFNVQVGAAAPSEVQQQAGA